MNAPSQIPLDDPDVERVAKAMAEAEGCALTAMMEQGMETVTHQRTGRLGATTSELRPKMVPRWHDYRERARLFVASWRMMSASQS